MEMFLRVGYSIQTLHTRPSCCPLTGLGRVRRGGTIVRESYRHYGNSTGSRAPTSCHLSQQPGGAFGESGESLQNVLPLQQVWWSLQFLVNRQFMAKPLNCQSQAAYGREGAVSRDPRCGHF